MQPMIKTGMNNKQMKPIAMDAMSSKKPMIAKSKKGLLHKKLAVPQGKKIPAKKMSKALKSKSPALRKEANFAQNFGK